MSTACPGDASFRLDVTGAGRRCSLVDWRFRSDSCS